MGKLDQVSQTLIGRVILQGFSHEEAGRLLGCTRRTVERNLQKRLTGSARFSGGWDFRVGRGSESD